MSQFESMALPPRLPLVVIPSNRNSSTAKDAKLVNCYIEADPSGEMWIYKRPGVIEDSRPPGADILGLGLFNWEGDVYSIFGSVLYRNGVQVAINLNNSQQVYQFSSILGATPKMVLGNGFGAYAYDVVGGLSAELHTINIDFPDDFVKGWAYLNGAQYVMNSEAVIWGSVPNSVSVPGDWTPLNFVSAQIEPDNGVGLNKQLVYVIAFNQWSTEVFFDAGNPEGSPLGPVQGSKVSYGCVTADSVQSIDTVLIWLSFTRAAAVQVALMEGLSVRMVSTKSIERLLEEADYTTVYSWQVKLNGHNFYIVTIKNSNLTLAYDLSQDLWSQWTTTSGNYLPYVAATFDADNDIILQHETNGRLYKMDVNLFNDSGDVVIVDIVTPIFDAGTRRRKQVGKLEVVADQQPGSELMIRKSDDDYQTWSTFRKVSLGQKNPQLINCGTFTKRAYHLRCESNTPFRIQAIELQYDIGTI